MIVVGNLLLVWWVVGSIGRVSGRVYTAGARFLHGAKGNGEGKRLKSVVDGENGYCGRRRATDWPSDSMSLDLKR
jgi:hypothetical protein